MGGKDAKALEAMNGQRTQTVARKRTIYPNYELSIEKIPEGVDALVVRMDAPYERHDFLLPDDKRAELLKLLQAPHVDVPDILPPFLQR